MASVLDAARDLFAARGPSQVSLRDVAQRANVNHALIHRHFGSKDNLLKTVLHREAQGFAASIVHVADPAAATEQLFDENSRRAPFVRIMTFSLLSGVPVETLYSEEGALAPLLELVREAAGDTTDRTRQPAVQAHVAVAAVSAFIKGWLLFEPWVLHAVGADPDGEHGPDVREQVTQILQHVIGLAAADRSG